MIDSILSNLKYENTVNMRNVTSLPKIEFSNRLSFGYVESSTSTHQESKAVNFLDKFTNSAPIDINEAWEVYENEVMLPEKRYLRVRDKP